MDLERVPGPVWDLLANQAISASQAKQPVWRVVDDYFYKHVYRRWTIDFQKIEYTSNLAGVKDVGWKQIAERWKKGFRKLLPSKDQSVGETAMQTDENDPDHRGTRLGEKYSDEPGVSRFQFLVSSGGGLVLLNRMRRACQTCIADNPWRVVKWWKVFGESFADQGQSDACVVYLLRPFDDRYVLHFINNYVWPNIKDIVNDKFVPVGLVQIDDKPLWGVWIPSKDKWSQEFGKGTIPTHYGSAGGLMGLVFGYALEEAVMASPKAVAAELIPVAKEYGREILERLAE
jgi:hypothetical protein